MQVVLAKQLASSKVEAPARVQILEEVACILQFAKILWKCLNSCFMSLSKGN